MFILETARGRNLALILGIILVGACSSTPNGAEALSASTTPDSASIQPLRLTLYETPTPSQAVESPTIHIEAPTPPPPTVTPFLYTVVAKDTLIGIAERFNVSLEDLLAANPEVDPGFLSVDTVLIIPIGGDVEAVALPTPTPIPVSYGEAYCYATAEGRLWCFLPVQNDQPEALENLSGIIHLYSNSGEVLASEEASALLNLLYPGQAMPLVAYFEEPPPQWDFLQAQVTTALAIPAEDDRYLATSVDNLEIRIDEDGLHATTAGQVRLTDEERPAFLVWVAVIAYSEDGRVVGVRRWENLDEQEGGSVLPFEVEIYSLGPPIEQVDVIVEARP